MSEIRNNQDLYDATSVSPGLRTPATCFDWELSQAIIHLKNAISVTDSHRAHLLQSAISIAKGVREND